MSDLLLDCRELFPPRHSLSHDLEMLAGDIFQPIELLLVSDTLEKSLDFYNRATSLVGLADDLNLLPVNFIVENRIKISFLSLFFISD